MDECKPLPRGAPPLEDGLVPVPLDMRATRDDRGPPLAKTGWLLPMAKEAAPGMPAGSGVIRESGSPTPRCRAGGALL